jgi:hypothetical protein
MSLTSWFRRLLRSDPEKRAAAQLSHDERLRARLEAESAKAEAEAIRQQFGPPTPPGGFGL